jgi:hypothetical protein
MYCPKEKTPAVLEFAKSIVDGGDPVYVDCSPLRDKPQLECFEIVECYASENGGERKLGWSIYIWPEVMIQAEFHAVWCDPFGKLHDISPHELPMKQILFLPDPDASYGKIQQVNNHRMALNPDPNINRLIKVENLIYTEENRGEFAMKDHFVSTPLWESLQKEKLDCLLKLTEEYGPSPGTSAESLEAMKFLSQMFF